MQYEENNLWINDLYYTCGQTSLFYFNVLTILEYLISGENCHRGAALGALLGASAPWKGTEISQHYKDGLGSAKNELVQVLDAMQSKM